MSRRVLTALTLFTSTASLSSQTPAGVPDVRAATVVVRTTYSATGISPSVANTTADKTANSVASGLLVTPDNPSHADFVCTGAVSGTATDSQVIQAAIDYLDKATGSGGGRVVLMEGTYNITSPIVLSNSSTGTNSAYNGIIIEGQSTCGISMGWQTPTKRTGTILRTPANLSAILSCTRVSHLELRSLTFQMGDGTTNYTGTAASFSDCTDVRISRCTFDYCERAIYNNGGWDFFTNECAFRSCGTSSVPAVVADGQGLRITATNNPLGIAQPNVAGWKLFQCTWFPKPGVCFHSETVEASDIQFLQCKFEGFPGGPGGGVGRTAITGKYHFLLVSGCTFFHVDDGVLTHGGLTFGPHIKAESDQGSIVNSTFWGYDYHAIWLRGHQNKIQGNQFRYTKNYPNAAAPRFTESHIWFDTIWPTAPYADENLVMGNTSWSEHHWDPSPVTLPIADESSPGGVTAVNNLGH